MLEASPNKYRAHFRGRIAPPQSITRRRSRSSVQIVKYLHTESHAASPKETKILWFASNDKFILGRVIVHSGKGGEVLAGAVR